MAEKSHSRRKFLKYAGAGVAAGAIAAVGYEVSRYWPSSPTTSPNPNGTISTPASPSPTTSSATSTSKLYTLKGRIVKDLNMNGKQDMDEIGIPDATIVLNNYWYKAITDSSGDYKMDVPAGDYKLSLVVSDRKLRYMCTSPAECRPLIGVSRDFDPKYRSYYDIEISEEEDVKRFDIGVSEGWATEPFPRKKDYDFIYTYVDDDPRPGYSRDWSGGQHSDDGFYGISYAGVYGNPICAIAPGVVIQAEDLFPQSRTKNPWYPVSIAGNYVLVDHENGFMGLYCNMSKINVEPRELTLDLTNPNLQRVKRGEIIGFVGNTGFVWKPSIMFLGLLKYVSRDHFMQGGYPCDPYRDLYYKPETGWGMGDFCYSNPVSIWTEDNNPHSPT